jgi:hypothetical protein
VAKDSSEPQSNETKYMKKHILALLGSLSLSVAGALAHGGIELGPNGGRIVEFSKDETMHGEVTVKDGKFQVALLDKAMKPVKVGEQTVTASGGASGKAEKLTVEKSGDSFVVPTVKPGEWLILQYKENPKAKAVTARLQYDTATCEKCKAEEWICKCEELKKEKK